MNLLSQPLSTVDELQARRLNFPFFLLFSFNKPIESLGEGIGVEMTLSIDAFVLKFCLSASVLKLNFQSNKNNREKA